VSAAIGRFELQCSRRRYTDYIDITGNFATQPWLLYDWDNDSSHNDYPKGKATFSLYKGNSRQIYFREVY